MGSVELVPEDWASYSGAVCQRNLSIFWEREQLFQDGKVKETIRQGDIVFRIHSAMLEVLRESGTSLLMNVQSSNWARFPDPLSDAFIGCPSRETLAEWAKRGELLRFADEYAGKICRFFESEADKELFVLLTYCRGTPSSPSWGLIRQSEA